MQIAAVVGHATATVKHRTLQGWRLLVVQPVDMRGQPDGDPQLAIDDLGSRRGDRVIITSDGAAVREMVGAKDTPIRWAILGVADE